MFSGFIREIDSVGRIVIPKQIRKELGIPVKFIGVGEKIDDMKPFDSKDFASALFETN